MLIRPGLREYIVEDMVRGGLRNVTGINFTEGSKEAIATALKESMRTANCPMCDYTGYVDGDMWQTSCPDGCRLDDERSAPLRPLMHIPYDPDLFAELNVERYELRKTGKILFSHPQGTHDDRFWAVALGNYAVEMEPSPSSRPIGKTVLH